MRFGYAVRASSNNPRPCLPRRGFFIWRWTETDQSTILRHTLGESLSVSKSLVFALLLVVSSAGQATSPSNSGAPAQSSRSHRGAAPGGERSLKGCLTKDESGTYFLLTQRSSKVRLDSADDLTSRVGELIRVSGAFVDTHPATGGGTSAASQAHTNSAVQSHPTRAFRVFKVDVLSQSCSVRKK